jgi:hypothetical protein
MWQSDRATRQPVEVIPAAVMQAGNEALAAILERTERRILYGESEDGEPNATTQGGLPV